MISRVLEAVVLGVTQGVTEFLPLSSSGHLVLVPWLLGWSKPGVAFDLTLHLGTLLAVMLYFRKELAQILRETWGAFTKMDCRSLKPGLAWLLVVGTIPGALAGYFFEDVFESLFRSPMAVGVALVLTGVFLFGSEAVSRRERSMSGLDWRDGLIVGAAQALAIAPGISRSGWTIGAALLRNIDREAATRFSFLLSVPIILLASLSRAREIMLLGANGNWLVLMVGFLTAAVSGYVAIKYLLKFVASHGFFVFAGYCLIVGTGTIFLSLIIQ